MSYRAILFDVGGPIDMEFAWEIAVDGAIAAAWRASASTRR
jgi:putative hydrolase of the HAD superfamily